MTRQEMFNLAYIGLRGQGFQKSMDKYGNCLYLGKNGCRCAWGHVDPQGASTREAEGLNVFGLNDHKIGLAGSLEGHNVNWACQLQECHDDADSTQDMDDRLRVFAEKHGLTVPA